MKFTKELVEKAKGAGTAEELTEIAKAEGMEMTAEEAEKYFAELHKTGELADEELDNVSGGCRNASPTGTVYSPEDFTFLYEVGQIVEVYDIGCGTLTTRSKIINREMRKLKNYYGCDPYVYTPFYHCESIEKPDKKRWVEQDMIELP